MSEPNDFFNIFTFSFLIFNVHIFMMKSKLILLSAAAALTLASACNQNGEQNSIDPVFQLNTDYLNVPMEGGDVTLSYQFQDRPESGSFYINIPEGHWISYLGDNPETSTLSFNVEANATRERADTIVIRYDYNEGFLLDTAIISQAGINADVFIDAKDCTGEYYESDRSYYTWVSTLGLWTEGSEGLNLDLYSSEDPVIEEYEYNGSTYRRLLTLPAGTYVFDETNSGDPGTFSANSFYGIGTDGYDYSTRYDITGGTVTITDLGNNKIQIEAEVTCSDGLTYGLFFSGSIHDYPYIRG